MVDADAGAEAGEIVLKDWGELANIEERIADARIVNLILNLMLRAVVIVVVVGYFKLW